MNAEIKLIRSLALRSVANLFALWYGFWGVAGGAIFASSKAARLQVPLGLFIPFVDWHLNFSVTRAPTLPGAIVQAMIFVLFCATTGWVSGLLTALVYNLIARHLGFQLRGTIGAEPLPDRQARPQLLASDPHYVRASSEQAIIFFNEPQQFQ